MIKTIIKLAIATGLLAYLISNGKLDFSLLLKSLNEPGYFFLGFIMLISQCAINAIRWKLILSTQTKEIVPSIFIIMVNWVGMFFNTVLPGAVSGDLVKMMYLKKVDEGLTKTSMFLTVLMDRIYGLVALISITGFISIIRYEYLVSINDDVKSIVSINLLLLIGIILFISTLFVSKNLQDNIMTIFKKIPKIGNQLSHIMECFWNIGQNRAVLFKSIIISILGQFLGLSSFYFMTYPLASGAINLQDIYTFVPIGMIITAIPLAPGGMGVGHVAFDKLFHFLEISNGADLFNVFWVSMMLINLLGVVPYLLLGKKKDRETRQVESF
tara:strand:+ start:53 stop:1033 length:981 start_codon:yes stop_codon:yes gene_type:complete